MTEHELFAAYGGLDGTYRADCACGGVIVAQSGGEYIVGAAIDAHQHEPLHVQWREWQAAVDAVKRPPRHRCPCCGGDPA